MKYRKLRIAWSVAWGVVTLLLVGLWIRSYWWRDMLSFGDYLGRYLEPQSHLIFASIDGRIGIHGAFRGWPEGGIENWPIKLTHDNARNFQGIPNPYPTTMGFRIGRPIIIPHLFPVLISFGFATIPWIRQLKLRYSLRTLLIATTLIAVVLGIIVWMSRAG